MLSELRKGERADRGVTDWFAQERAEEMWLSVLVIGELRQGVALLARRDPPAAAAIGEWVDETLIGYADRVLDITRQVAERWAEISVPDPLPVVDGLLSATAIEHDLSLVSRNTRDIGRSGARYINPFSGR